MSDITNTVLQVNADDAHPAEVIHVRFPVLVIPAAGNTRGATKVSAGKQVLAGFRYKDAQLIPKLAAILQWFQEAEFLSLGLSASWDGIFLGRTLSAGVAIAPYTAQITEGTVDEQLNFWQFDIANAYRSTSWHPLPIASLGPLALLSGRSKYGVNAGIAVRAYSSGLVGTGGRFELKMLAAIRVSRPRSFGPSTALVGAGSADVAHPGLTVTVVEEWLTMTPANVDGLLVAQSPLNTATCRELASYFQEVSLLRLDVRCVPTNAYIGSNTSVQIAVAPYSMPIDASNIDEQLCYHQFNACTPMGGVGNFTVPASSIVDSKVYVGTAAYGEKLQVAIRALSTVDADQQGTFNVRLVQTLALGRPR